MQTRPLGQGRASGLLEHSILLSCSGARLMKMDTCSEPLEPCTSSKSQGLNKPASFHLRVQSSLWKSWEQNRWRKTARALQAGSSPRNWVLSPALAALCTAGAWRPSARTLLALSQGWTRALRPEKCVPTSGAALCLPATCASLNSPHIHLQVSLSAWWQTAIALSSNPGPDINAHASIPEFCWAI